MSPVAPAKPETDGEDLHPLLCRAASGRRPLEAGDWSRRSRSTRGWGRRWLAGIRQIVETVYDKLFHTWRLDRERPHDLSGFQARLAAKIALHNFCIWLHEQLGRPRLAFTDLVAW